MAHRGAKLTVHGRAGWCSGSWSVVPVSTDPALEAKVVDVVGLYLDLLQNAVVLCVDEMSQIQSLDRTAPILPVQPI